MTDGVDDAALQRLYDDFAAANLKPLWTEISDLMPEYPEPEARPCHWVWTNLLPLAERAGDLVPVGRGGERRAIALANPGLGGRPYATTTLWAAIQYLESRRGCPGAPAFAGCLPVRRPRRGGLDRGERRPRADAGR